MKTSALLLTTLLFLAACKKETVVTPQNTPVNQQPANSNPTQSSNGTNSSDSKPPVTSGNTAPAVPDTIPDKAMLKIKLVKDSSNYDETMFMFNHTAKPAYNVDYDSPYMDGFGQESLASLSSDNHDLVVNTLPYSQGLSVALDVNTNADGAFALQLSYLKSVPSDIQVFIKDNHLKDSVDLRTGVYKFNVVKSDAATYGANRFTVVFRNKAH